MAAAQALATRTAAETAYRLAHHSAEKRKNPGGGANRHSPFKFGQSYFKMCGYFCEQKCANNFSTKGLGDKKNGLV